MLFDFEISIQPLYVLLLGFCKAGYKFSIETGFWPCFFIIIFFIKNLKVLQWYLMGIVTCLPHVPIFLCRPGSLAWLRLPWLTASPLQKGKLWYTIGVVQYQPGSLAYKGEWEHKALWQYFQVKIFWFSTEIFLCFEFLRKIWNFPWGKVTIFQAALCCSSDM